MMWLNAFVFTILLKYCDCFKVLVIFGIPGPSHRLQCDVIASLLHKAGHEVTLISAFESDHVPEGVKKIYVNGNVKYLSSAVMAVFNISNIINKEVEINNRKRQFLLANEIFEELLKSTKLQALLSDTTQQFDAVIIDWYLSELPGGIATLLNCPLIWSSSMGTHWLDLSLVGEDANPAYSPDYYSSNVPPFTLWQRIEELWIQLRSKYYKKYVFMPKEKVLYENILRPIAEVRGVNMPPYEDIFSNASLVLVNEIKIISSTPKLPQNFKLIGGYTIQETLEPLPSAIQKIMDTSEHGVIYFSMGTTWSSKDLPTTITQGLLQLFGNLKQTVIWKYEVDLPNLPKNVYTLKWAPQQSILSHPNCLLFLTHGGIHSVMEAINYAVPIVGIPIYFDQFLNLNKAVAKGFAKTVNLDYNLPQNLKLAIDEVLNDTSYRHKVQRLKEAYCHTLVSPAAELVYWVEHVIVTQGAPHLRSSSHSMSLYKKLYLDAIALMLLVLMLILIALKKLYNKYIVNKIQLRKKKL